MKKKKLGIQVIYSKKICAREIRESWLFVGGKELDGEKETLCATDISKKKKLEEEREREKAFRHN